MGVKPLFTFFFAVLGTAHLVKRGTCLPHLKDSQNWTSIRSEWTAPTSGYAAMPLGNGRMGVKVNGAVDTEIYQLNDNTFWSGDPALQVEYNNGVGPDTSQPGTNSTIRRVAFQAAEAAIINAYKQGNTATQQVAAMAQADNAALKMWGPFETTSTFLPVGTLQLSVAGTAGYTNYKRTLDMDGARTIVTYRIGSTTYTRESFVSYPDRVMVIKMTSSDGTPINANVRLVLPAEMAAAVYEDGTPVTENNVTVDALNKDVVMKGRAPYYKSTKVGKDRWSRTRGITLEARVRVTAPAGGTLTPGNGTIAVKAPQIVLVYRSATSYVDPFTDPSGPQAANPAALVSPSISAAVRKGYDVLLNAHQTDFRGEFRRMWISLGGSDIIALDNKTAMSTSAYAMHYQYTRYQILCVSRANTSDRPNALQGIWTQLWTPQNQGSYFFNENIEKMYAAMEMQNIANSGDPLWKFMKHVAKNGVSTAANDFGYNDGSWATGHYTDIWVATTLRGGPNPSAVVNNEYVIWPHGGIWVMNQIYDSYAYSQNISFLNEYYGVIEGAAKFALNRLTTVDGLNGELKDYFSVPVSTSPEHTFQALGQTRALDVNTACDIELFNNIFQIIISASVALTAAGYSVDTSFVQRVQAAKPKLVPLQKYIAPWGSLKEYYSYNGTQPNHRHASHLITVFPLHYTGFNRRATPDLYKAAQGAYIDRGGAANAWHPDGTTAGVRLNMASQALRNPKHGLYNTYGTGTYQQWGAIGACVGEALLDSSNGELELLPFLPSEWSSGSVVGVRARGGYELSFSWVNRTLLRCQIDSLAGAGAPTVRYKGALVDLGSDKRFSFNRC